MTTTKPRRLYSLALAIVFPFLIAAVPAYAVIDSNAPAAGWYGQDTGVRDDLPFAWPEWDDEIAAEFPACQATGDEGYLADLIVVGQDGDAVRMTFDEVEARNTDGDEIVSPSNGYRSPGANDVWVVGVCPND